MLERKPKYEVKTRERKRPENVKEQIVKKREFQKIKTVSEQVAAERRRKAKKDRRNNPRKHHLALLGWNIFTTNVDRQQLTV